MDYRLVEMLAKTPPSSKLNNGWTKAIFRQAMDGIIPPEIQWRKDKKGFNLPAAKWMRGVLREPFLEVLSNSMLAEEYGFVNQRAVRMYYDRFCNGNSFISYKEIFNVYCLEMWLRQFQQYIGC